MNRVYILKIEFEKGEYDQQFLLNGNFPPTQTEFQGLVDIWKDKEPRRISIVVQETLFTT